MFSRSVRIIVLSCLVLLLATNLVFFTIATDTVNSSYAVIHSPLNGGSEFKFRGFKYFYQYVSTFPGLGNSTNALNYGLNLLSGQAELTAMGWLDAIVGVFYLLFSPVMLLVTLSLDVINNLVWLFGFFVPNWI